jgi:serine/threonine protein kinase
MRDLLADGAANTGELLAGRYRLESRVGEGGMATVYRALDEALGRTVAVKIFRPGADSDAGDLERRVSETRVLASLNHHALVTLFDSRIDSDEGAFLVMEFVDGPTLRARIADGPLSGEDTRGMAIDLAEALHVVHEGGVVHRDVKPSNILLGPSIAPGPPFRAKLADFGIAYLVDSARLTSPGTLMGTAAYVSPEQVRGAPPAPPADVYALGLLILECLTGSRAYPQSTTHESLIARLHKSPEIPGSLGYGWKSLLTAMTAQQPEDRPSALDVSIAVRDIVDESPLDATVSTVRLPEVTEASAPSFRELPDRTKPSILAGIEDGIEDSTEDTTEAGIDDRTHGRTQSHTEANGRRRWYVVACLVLVAAAAIVGAFLLVGSLASTTGPPPTLPALDEPLSTDLQNLMDEVTP